MNPSQLIDNHIKELSDWKGEVLINLRKVIHDADSEIEEGWKWGSPVFIKNGLICSIGTFKDHVKIHFFKGASLKDKNKLFNSGLDAKTMRAIDIKEKDSINKSQLIELIKEAVEFNSKK